MSEPTNPTAPSGKRLQSWLLVLLLGITAAVFGGVSGHEFVDFDDKINIYSNPHIKGLTAENLWWMFTDTDYARRYLPLGWLTYAVNYELFGLKPQAFHVVSLICHLLNVTLLFFLLKRLLFLVEPRAAERESGQTTLICAGLGTLFWAVNPLRVESVAWASSQIYCVAFCFTAIFLLAWLHAKDPALPVGRRRMLRGLSVIAFVASLLTYPLAIFAPVVLFVLEVHPLRRVGSRLSDWWKPGVGSVWVDKLPFLAIAAGGLVITLVSRVQTVAHAAPFTLDDFPLFSRAMQAFYIWGYYLWKPWVPFDLAILYPTLHAFNPLAPPFLLSALLVIGTSVVLFLLRRRWPGAFALWLCHLVLLVPVLGLSEYPHSPYDRYSYLQGVLWSVGLALLLRQASEYNQRGRIAGLTVAAASMFFALLAWQQVTVWRDTIPLYRHLLSSLGENPARSRFDMVLGVHYLRAGLTNDAVASFENAIRYESRRADRRILDEGVIPKSHVCLARIFAESGQPEQALAHYQTAINADSTSVTAMLGAGAILANMQRHEDALRWLQEVARLKPDSEVAEAAHQNMAQLLQKVGREADARRHLEEIERIRRKRAHHGEDRL